MVCRKPLLASMLDQEMEIGVLRLWCVSWVPGKGLSDGTPACMCAGPCLELDETGATTISHITSGDRVLKVQGVTDASTAATAADILLITSGDGSTTPATMAVTGG